MISAIRKDIPSQDVSDKFEFGPLCEHLSIQIYLLSKEVIIHNIYRTKGEIDLKPALDHHLPGILCGDFNAHHGLWDPAHPEDRAG